MSHGGSMLLFLELGDSLTSPLFNYDIINIINWITNKMSSRIGFTTVHNHGASVWVVLLQLLLLGLRMTAKEQRISNIVCWAFNVGLFNVGVRSRAICVVLINGGFVTAAVPCTSLMWARLRRMVEPFCIWTMYDFVSSHVFLMIPCQHWPVVWSRIRTFCPGEVV